MRETDADIQIACIRFQPTGKIYHFDASNQKDLQSGDYVLVRTARGRQLGEVINVRPLQDGEESAGLRPVQRRATGRDLAIRQQWKDQEDLASIEAEEMAREMNLPIKIVTSEYTFDGKSLTVLYASPDQKLDLTKLQRRLEQKRKTRVSLRRVGPRDQAKLMGGYGACGEQCCCARFLPSFHPVSIKMAKTQGVSLTPTEITGMCGRLRCCLVYENDLYVKACKSLPRRKKHVRTPHGEGRVIDLLPLKNVVVVQIEDRRYEVPADEVEVI